MHNLMPEQESIQLSLPVNAAYVSAARLTASSIANRMGFEIDEIEDIKAAVSEACTYTIKKLTTNKNENFQIKFHLGQSVLGINIKTRGRLKIEAQEDEMSLVMIKALMDEMEIENTEEDVISINMIKTHQLNPFG